MIKKEIEDYDMEYALSSLRGFNPDQYKPNQDQLLQFEAEAGGEIYHVFGVLDGHGTNGHLVSSFVKKKVRRGILYLI